MPRNCKCSSWDTRAWMITTFNKFARCCRLKLEPLKTSHLKSSIWAITNLLVRSFVTAWSKFWRLTVCSSTSVLPRTISQPKMSALYWNYSVANLSLLRTSPLTNSSSRSVTPSSKRTRSSRQARSQRKSCLCWMLLNQRWLRTRLAMRWHSGHFLWTLNSSTWTCAWTRLTTLLLRISRLCCRLLQMTSAWL